MDDFTYEDETKTKSPSPVRHEALGANLMEDLHDVGGVPGVLKRMLSDGISAPSGSLDGVRSLFR